MPDSNDVKLFLSGVHAWNAGVKDRKGQRHLDRPWRYKSDLSNAPIGNLMVQRVFDEAGYYLEQGTTYPRADLSLCDLRRTDFSTIFCGFDFRGAHFLLSNLTGANLRGADLSHAEFVGANLQDASLVGAVLDRARLDETNLTGTDLTATSPWRAHLFAAVKPNAQIFDTTPKPIESVSDLIALCSKLRGAVCPDRGPLKLYYRGEAKRWKLRPSVMRSPRYRGQESQMLFELMTRRPAEFEGNNTALAQWVLAQHHGLKTRLLDVTKNPLVAMFNICEDGSLAQHDGRLHVFGVPDPMIKPYHSDTISVIANFAKLPRADQTVLLGKRRGIKQTYEEALGKLYHLIGEEKPHFRRQIDPRDFFRVFLVEPQLSFNRLNAQSGAFLLSAFHERFERESVLRWNGGIPVYDHVVLDVPAASKSTLLKELELLNITRETLFPGLDAAAKAIDGRVSRGALRNSNAHIENMTWKQQHSLADLPRPDMPPDPWLEGIPTSITELDDHDLLDNH